MPILARSKPLVASDFESNYLNVRKCVCKVSEQMYLAQRKLGTQTSHICLKFVKLMFRPRFPQALGSKDF